MFLKRLIIENKDGVIRDIKFNIGLNLIVDNTKVTNHTDTKSNVGKTTVLKLVDYCLGGDQKVLYTDINAGKHEYEDVKNFLFNTEVRVILTMVDDLKREDAKKLVIERNFLKRNKAIRKINDVNYENESDFENALKNFMFPNLKDKKPTFRHLVAHNVRYKSNAIDFTIKHLDRFTSDIEYEALFLYLMDCPLSYASKKEKLYELIKQEKVFKERLEKKQTKGGYQISIGQLEYEIKELEKKKNSLNLNPNFERDLDKLNECKYNISRISSKITNHEIKRKLIEESKELLLKDKSKIDLKELEELYHEIKSFDITIQKTFNQMVSFHNSMVDNKISFILKELPSIQEALDNLQKELNQHIALEGELTEKISKTDSFSTLDGIVVKLNEKFRLKGEYEIIVQKIKESEDNLAKYETELSQIANEEYSDSFEEKLKSNVEKFNRFFSEVSNKLYFEQYLLKYDFETSKNTKTNFYKFTTFNKNMGSGKKQGEILAFDIAYIWFADDNSINCLHFLLNDKKELMSDNQLVTLKDYLLNKNPDLHRVVNLIQKCYNLIVI